MSIRILSPLALFGVLVFVGTGCYHATIETGLTGSSEVIEESFASAWVYGLVPPSTISTQAKCKHGVARVETQISFVNGLVRVVTFGIYTPMSIKVTCAASSTSMLEGRAPDVVIGEDASEEEIQHVFGQAAELAVASGKPVFVKY